MASSFGASARSLAHGTSQKLAAVLAEGPSLFPRSVAKPWRGSLQAMGDKTAETWSETQRGTMRGLMNRFIWFVAAAFLSTKHWVQFHIMQLGVDFFISFHCYANEAERERDE